MKTYNYEVLRWFQKYKAIAVLKVNYLITLITQQTMYPQFL